MPFSYDDIVHVGESIDLVCQVSKGDQPMQIMWTFESDTNTDRQPSITTHRISRTASALNIPSATEYHSGTYICTVSNSAGKVAYKSSITVNGIH